MSVSLESWEGLISTVQQFYTRNLLPYYNEEYLTMCLEIMGLCIGNNMFDYVLTIVSLPEPICINNKIIVISLPMLQNLLDRSVIFSEHKLEQVDNFDIFEQYNILQNPTADELTCSVNEYMIRWNNYSMVNSGFDKMTTSQTISMVMVFRLVYCIAHWSQHYKSKTPFTQHDRFVDLQVADLKNKVSKLLNPNKKLEKDDDDTNDDDDDDDNED